jgi:hypothetical protein
VDRGCGASIMLSYDSIRSMANVPTSRASSSAIIGAPEELARKRGFFRRSFHLSD